MKMIRTYSELSKLKTFRDRYEYLKLGGKVGEETFGFDRYLNQIFYKSPEWLRTRDIVIERDNGCDLGVRGHDIYEKIIIHHMNPIDPEDIFKWKEILLNPEYLISTVLTTHNAIHYGDARLLVDTPIERRPNDTSPWKMKKGD